MAGNIKGIIVEIGGDTSGLQNALKKVNSASASLSKELRGINSLLKLDPKNTELLAQKQNVLKQKISETVNQLKLLKEAQSQYIQSGGDLNSDKYRNLQREIIKTENELKNLKIEASGWTAASKKLDELGQSMTKFGDKVTDVGKKVSVLSAAITALFASGTKYNMDMEKYTTAFSTFLGSAEEAEAVIENIKKQSESSPFDTADLIKSNQMLITTGESAEDAQKTISALADAIALTGGGNDELTRMAANLQQIRNAGKATSMDIRQFAYAGIDVYGILSATTGKTTEEIKKMDITYQDLSKSLQMAASEGGKYYNGQGQMAETLTGQISRLKKTFKELTGELSKGLYPILKKITEKLQDVVDWVKNSDEKTKNMITGIGLFVAALGPALVTIGKLIALGGKVAGTLSKLSAWIAKISASVGGAGGSGGLAASVSSAAGPIGIIVAAIAAWTAAVIYFYKTNEDFKKKFDETWNGVIVMFNEKVVPCVKNIWELVITVVDGIKDTITKWWQIVQPIILGILNWAIELWNSTIKDIVEQVIYIVDELTTAAKNIYSNFIKPIIDWLVENLYPKFLKITEAIVNATKSKIEHIAKLIKSFYGVLKGVIQFISGVFSGDWKKAWEGVKTIFSNLMGGLYEIIKVPLNKIIDGVNTFIGGLNRIQIPDWVPGVGGKGLNIPTIPRLAKGGIVDKATLAMIGEGKSSEAVIPLDKTLTRYMAEALKMAGSNKNIVLNFYPQQMTEAELDRAFNYVDRRFGMIY